MAEAADVKDRKGWFKGLGRDGDRTIEEQMIGLERLLAEVRGKTVLDVGCAEGLISMELAAAGADHCTGLELVHKFVDVGNRIAAERRLPCTFTSQNLNSLDLAAVSPKAFDVVLMLAVLHKVKHPSAVCAALAGAARDLVVIRLPPYGPVIRDQRSNFEPHDIGAVMETAGFTLESVVAGPKSEWLGYFRRVGETKAAVPETIAPESETPSSEHAAIEPASETPAVPRRRRRGAAPAETDPTA